MTKSLKVLFVPYDAAGHVYANISLGQALLRAGHRVLFAVYKQWTQILEKYGFEVVTIHRDDIQNSEDPVKRTTDRLLQSKLISDASFLEKALQDNRLSLVKRTSDLDNKLGQILRDIGPDVIVCDQFMTLPSVETSGIPWVWTWSANPLMMYGNDEDVPIPRLGNTLKFLKGFDLMVFYKGGIRCASGRLLT